MSILQTEASFVSFCHFGAIQTQQVIVSENLHAVVMSGWDKTTTLKTSFMYTASMRDTPRVLGSMYVTRHQHYHLGLWSHRLVPCSCLTCDTRARPRIGDPPVAGNLSARCSGSGRRSAGGGGRSWGRRCQHFWTSTSPPGHTAARTWVCPLSRWSVQQAGHSEPNLGQLGRRPNPRVQRLTMSSESSH